MISKTLIGGLILALGLAAFVFYQHPQPAPLPPEISESKLAAIPAHAASPATPVGFTRNAPPSPQADVPSVRTTDDLLQTMTGLLKSSEPADREKLLALLAELVKNDPAAAARFAESVPVENGREEILRRVAQWWTAQDPVAVENWAAQLTNETERQSALSDVCFQVAAADARQAVLMGERYGLGTTPGAVMDNLVQQWAAQDYAGATDWVQKQAAGEPRDQMYARLAYVQSQSAPGEAAKLVVEQIPPGPIQTEAAITVLHQWAQRDMAGAADWVAQFPAGDLKVRAENELTGVLGYRKP